MIESKIRKWGNSYGVLIPKGEIDKKQLSENDKVVITLERKVDLGPLFGICKFKKSTKEIIKEIREGYDD